MPLKHSYQSKEELTEFSSFSILYMAKLDIIKLIIVQTNFNLCFIKLIFTCYN